AAITQRRRERLLDVAWLLSAHAHRTRGVDLGAGRAEALRAELAEHGEAMLEERSPDALLRMYAALGDRETLPRLGLERGVRPGDLTDPDDRLVLKLVRRW